MPSGFSTPLHLQTRPQIVFQGPSHSSQHLPIRNPPTNWQHSFAHRKEDIRMCFALPCYQLSATASSEGRKKGMQNHSTASLLSSWQKPSELLGLLINLPSGQAAGAMQRKGGNRHFQTHTQIFEVTSCLDNQLLFSLSSRSR